MTSDLTQNQNLAPRTDAQAAFFSGLLKPERRVELRRPRRLLVVLNQVEVRVV